MKNSLHSKFSLEPLDKGQRQSFMQFRNEDVHQMFTYICFMGFARVVIALIALLDSQSRVELIILANWIFLSILHWIVWALGKRFKDKMVYLIPTIHLITHLVVVVTVETINISEVNSVVPVKEVTNWVFDLFAMNTLLLAPSIWHVALLYMPCYLLSVIFFEGRLSENV